MSPPPIRRYRAERLLREEFERLRERVLATVSARLRAGAVRVDRGDLDSAYSQAWQGLYAAVLDGQAIDNPAGWLALVTYRRAIDEHRARGRARRVAFASAGDAVGGSDRPAWRGSALGGAGAGPQEPDFAAALDDRTKLRHLFEALRARLDAREQQAATLCYLQGLSRAEAAARMGVSEARMRKLMDGRGRGLLGVAGKLGALVETIGAGRWCEEQGSLMRGFAYGILDPDGERHALASMHQSECPACRAYVLSLRGLAAALPPLPSLLHLALGAGSSGGTVAVGGVAAGSGAGAGAGTGAGVGTGAGALSASGAAGAGAVGGGWWLAGPLAGKLALGCALALGVGVGCVALDPHALSGGAAGHRRPRRPSAVVQGPRASRKASPVAHGARARPVQDVASTPASAHTAQGPIARSAKVVREFGPEGAASTSVGDSGATSRHLARIASAATTSPARATPGEGESAARNSHGGTSAAQREFSPG
jgi:DNA-directed RNA polymerase specialized sigma24 family protein